MEQVKRDDKGKFLPGASGNPQGRPPRDQTVTEFLRQKIPADMLADMIADKVRAGNDTFLKTVLEYYDGKPINKILEGPLDIVESEEWEGLLRLIIGLVEKYPEIKPDIDEIFKRMDDTERSGRILDEAFEVDAGQDTELSAAVEGKADNMQLSPSVGQDDDDSDQGTPPGEILDGSTDTGSIADREAESGDVQENIRSLEPSAEDGQN